MLLKLRPISAKLRPESAESGSMLIEFGPKSSKRSSKTKFGPPGAARRKAPPSALIEPRSISRSCDAGGLGEACRGRDTYAARKVPERCSPHALPSVSQRCRRAPKVSSSGSQTRDFCPNFGQSQPSFGDVFVNVGPQSRPKSAILVQRWARDVPSRADVAKLCSVVWATLAQLLGRVLGNSWTMFGSRRVSPPCLGM